MRSGVYAARLQGEASAGEVLIAEATARIIGKTMS